MVIISTIEITRIRIIFLIKICLKRIISVLKITEFKLRIDWERFLISYIEIIFRKSFIEVIIIKTILLKLR